MKKSILFLLFLFLRLTVIAQTIKTNKSEQTEQVKIAIIKTTVEFLASDSSTFKNIKEPLCSTCENYQQLTLYVVSNKIKRADSFVRKWQVIKIDTNSATMKRSLTHFKDLVINDISSGSKVKRKQLANYPSYISALDQIVENISSNEFPKTVKKASSLSDSIVKPKIDEPVDYIPNNLVEAKSYLDVLPNVPKGLSYLITMLFSLGIIFLLWMFNSKSTSLKKKIRLLKDQVIKLGSEEWQWKSTSNELENALQELKISKEEIIQLKENLRLKENETKNFPKYE